MQAVIEGLLLQAQDAADRAETAAAGVEFPVSYGVAQSLSDAQKALARANVGAAAETVTPGFTGATPTLLRLITEHYVNPDWFGTMGGATADTEFTKAMTAAIEDDKPVKIGRDYTLDTIDLSGVAAGGSLRLEHIGVLTHVDGASDHMFAFGVRDYLEIIGPGVFDGQQADQTVDTIIIPVDNITHFYLRGPRFKNVKKGAVHQRSSAVGDIFRMDQFTVKDGALHDGILNGKQCNFIRFGGGQLVHISDYRMIQTADPVAGQNRNPSGIFYINTGGPAVAQKVIIENGYLENLGYHCAGNLVGGIDFYSRCENIRLRNNTIRKPRVLPIRTAYASTIEIVGNNIDHPEQAIIDGAGNYTDESAISVGIVDRGYVTDFGNVDTVKIEGNVVTINNNNCHGISANNASDNDALMQVISAKENVIISTGANTSFGAVIAGVSDYLSENNHIDGFPQGVRVQSTSRAGSAVAALGTAKVTFHKDRIDNVQIGIYARADVANLDVTIDDCAIDASALTYSVRSAKNVRVTQNTLSNAGDTSTNAAFWYKDNNAGGTDPVGYTTNTYYRLKDNVGRADAASA